MTHFEFTYHVVAYLHHKEARRLAIRISDASLKHGNPIAAPVFLTDAPYERKAEQKLNYYAAGQPGRGVGTLPMFDLDGKQIGGPKSLPKNLNTACPVDESEPRPSYFLKAECKLHGNKNKETGKVTPCKPEELHKVCKKTIANLKLKPVSAKTKHVGFHDDHCTANDCCTLHRELPIREEVLIQGTPAVRSVWEKPKQGVLGMGFATRSRDSEKLILYPEPRHLTVSALWKAAQDSKECLVQHHYHAIGKYGEYVFVKKLGKENLLTADRRKTARLPLLGGSSIWTEKWPAGLKGTATRRAPLGKQYQEGLDKLSGNTPDQISNALGQSDVAEWCRLNAVQVALLSTHKVTRDSRDGNYEQQSKFEGITKEPLFVSKAGKLHSVQSKSGYKHVDRASKPKVDAWEYVNRQPALILNKLAGELDWFKAEKLTAEELRKQYFNHFEYFAKAKCAAASREQLERREFSRVDARSAHQWVPRIGPNTEEEAKEWGSDKHIYTTWVIKTNKSRFNVHRFALNFAVKVNEARQRIQASRDPAKNVILDPLRAVSNWTAAVEKSIKDQVKERKYYYQCKERGYAGSMPCKQDFIRERIKSQRCDYVEIAFPTSAWCKSGAVFHETSTVRDLNLKAIVRDESFKVVTMEDSMGPFYNVIGGVWQPYREGWKAVGVPAHQLQRTRLEQLFRYDITSTENVPYGWTVPTVELKSDYDGWLVCMKAKELHNVHFKPSAELAIGNESCTCWHCGDKFLMYYSLQSHVDKHYTCKTFKEYCCTLLNKDYTVTMQHKHYGAVKFIRVLPSNENRVWLKKSGGSVGVDISTLKLKTGENLKGSETLKWLMKRFYEPMQEPSRIVTMSEAQTETLHNYLCVIYPSDFVKALRDFRVYRREQGYTLLTENTYKFLEILEKRKMKGEELAIQVAKDTTDGSVRWVLKISNSKMSLGVIGSPTRKDVPSKQEVLEHCVVKARDTYDNPKLTAEWAAWVIKAHICRLDGCTWYDGGDDVLSPLPGQPSSFIAKQSITENEPRGVLVEEEDDTY